MSCNVSSQVIEILAVEYMGVLCKLFSPQGFNWSAIPLGGLYGASAGQNGISERGGKEGSFEPRKFFLTL